MQQLLKPLILCLLSQFALANSNVINPIVDSIPTKKWTYSLQAGFFPGFNPSKTYYIGVSAERSFTKTFSIEGELGLEYLYRDYSVFGLRRINDALNLDASISAKFYFNDKRKWFGKIGYHFSPNLTSNIIANNERPYSRNLSTHGLQLGVGRNWHFKNGKILNIENRFRLNQSGLSANLKIGLTF